MWIPGLGQEGFAVFILGSWFAYSGETQPPPPVDSQQAYREAHLGKNWGLPLTASSNLTGKPQARTTQAKPLPNTLST